MAAKATASATIEPKGRRGKTPRDHLITLTLTLSGMDANHGDKTFVAEIVRKALAGFGSGARKFGEISVPHKNARTVTGLEGSLVASGRPEDEAMDQLRATLTEQGYYLTVREMRECSQTGCLSDCMVDWNRPELVPTRWYSNVICGKHDYKTCAKCQTIYSMTSVNSPGQAPSVYCEVCGTVLVEWGSSKIWQAERVHR